MTSTSAADPPAARERVSPLHGLAAAIQRRSGYIKAASILLIVVALLVTVRALPLDRAIDLLTMKVDALGFWGPLAFGVAYVAAALALFPGSALGLAAPALFGVVGATVTVSLASTAAASLAFLIARYLARDRVARQARRYPKFEAIDAAIGARGWKIIAMLRLSPAIPFSLSNYLFGLTAIRFWPYVMASWLFMLPGTIMYVYVGHLGTEGLRSASGAEGGKTSAEWALLGVGLLATIAVTAYVARLARKAMRAQTETEAPAPMKDQFAIPLEQEIIDRTGWPWGTAISAGAAVAMLVVAACANQRRDALRSWFGPAPVTLQEAYNNQTDAPVFDHASFDRLLRKHVDKDGWVDYAGFRGDAESLDAYIASVGDAPFAGFGRDEKLAFLINAYNAFTLRLILDHYPIESIKNIPSAKRWDARRWRIGSMTLSLNQIEHEQIRPKFAEPRIHFALVCAAIGCPKLRNEAYQADRIEQQLEDQTRFLHAHDRWFRYSVGAKEVHLTKLYDWYGADFKQVAGSPLEFAARYSSPLKAAIDKGAQPRIQWLDYDWTLNDKKNRR